MKCIIYFFYTITKEGALLGALFSFCFFLRDLYFLLSDHFGEFNFALDKCNSVFGLHERKRGLSYILGTNLFRLLLFSPGVFFDYSDAGIDVW